MRKNRYLRLCVVLLGCNLLVIWGNSLLPGEISGAISSWVKAALERLFAGGEAVGSGDGFLRKLAHFTEFTALGFLLGWLHILLGKRPEIAFLWGVAAAGVDETIQRFIPGRCGCLRDVAIDSCGVLTGILLFCCATKIKQIWRK